jgi:hypothetical protein
MECEKPSLGIRYCNLATPAIGRMTCPGIQPKLAQASNQNPWRKFADSLRSTRMRDGSSLWWSIGHAGLFSEQMQLGPSAKNRERMLS